MSNPLFRKNDFVVLALFSVFLELFFAGCPAKPKPVRERGPAPLIQRAPIPVDTNAIHIGLIGDWGTGHVGQRNVFRAVQKVAQLTPYTFLLTLGDNFYPSGVSDTSDPKWKSVYEATYGSLSLPIYPSLGNHDHLGNIWAQVDYSKMHSRWNMPAPYYGIVQPLDSQTSLLLLAIDTDVLRQGKDPQQLLWIKDQLQNTKAHWKIVYGHHPIYSSGAHGENEYLKAHLDPILVETKTDLYIAGHDHTLEIIRPNHGVVYAIAGGGGGKERAYPIKKGPHTVYGTTGGGFLDLWVSVKSMRIEAHPLSTPKPAPFTIPKTVPASK